MRIKQTKFNVRAKRLAKRPDMPVVQPDPPPPWAAFRPITGNRTDQPLPPVEPIRWRRPRKPGSNRKQEPTEMFLMVMTRREKRQWQRAAADLGLPLSAVIRLSMRFFLSSNKMQKIVKTGPRQYEFFKRVRKNKLWQRIESTMTDRERYEFDYNEHVHALNAEAKPPSSEAPCPTTPSTPSPTATRPSPGSKPRLMIVPSAIPRLRSSSEE